MLCIIGYGSAWAFEGHATEIDEFNSIIAIGDIQCAGHHSADCKVCDHCCHAFAHMLAICAQSFHLFNSNKTSESMEFSQNYTSLIASPDLRPPRA